MTSQQKENFINDLRFIQENPFKLYTKIAIISFYNIRYSKIVEILLALFEYFQLFSQIFFLILETKSNDTDLSKKPLFRSLVIFCQIFNPFSSFHSQSYVESPLAVIIFSALVICIIIKNLIHIYIVYTTHHNIQQKMSILKIWRWLFKTQSRVLYFISSSFWVAIIRVVSQNSLDVYGFSSTNVLIFCTLMIIIEYLNSIYFLIPYVYVLPTKNFLSEKDNYTQLITLTQKFILQILQIVLLSSYSTVNAWIFSSVCILADLLRSSHHFKTLPLYNIKALFFQGDLLMIINSLSLSWFFQIILNSSTDYDVDEFLWITWIFLACLEIIACGIYLKEIIFQTVSRPKISSSQLLIHKMSLIKQIRKIAISYNDYQSKYKFWYLLKETVSKNFNTIFNIDSELIEETLQISESKESCNKIFLHYLEYLVSKYPKDNFLKLHMAFYAKKLKQYGKAIKIALDLKKANQYLIELNTSLLILDIQNMIRSNYEDPSAKINLFLYTRSQSHFAELKNKTLKQAELQIQLCQEIISDSPRLGKISEWSLEIHKYQKDVEKRAKRMFEVIPDYFIEPIAFLAYYYMTVNHSIVDSLKYRKMYDNKSEKYKKYFKSEELQEETLYQSQNNFMIISGHKADAGKVLFCSKNIEQIYGGDARMFVGKDITNVVVPCLQSLVSFKDLIENATQSKMDNVIRWYGWHKDCYMVEVDYYLNVFPFLNRGFCFGALTRLVNTNNDCIVINRIGIIEATTKNVRDNLLKESEKSIVNIKVLSEELSKVNKAFNMVTGKKKQDSFAKKHEENQSYSQKISEDHQKQAFDLETVRPDDELDIENAKMLHSIFSSDGKEITMRSIHDNKIYFFHCKIIQLPYEDDVKRIINLYPIDGNEEEQEEGDLEITMLKASKEEPSKNIDHQETNIVKQEEEIKSELETPISPPRVSRFKFDRLDESNNYNYEERTYIDSPKKSFAQLMIEKTQTETSNLLSPNGLLKTFTSSRHPFKDLSPTDQSPKISQQIYQKNEKEVRQHHDLKEQKVEGSVADSRMSKGFKQIKISKAFKEAVSVRSSRKYFKTSSILFYLILIGVFGIQLEIIVTWDDDIHNLKVKKDILNNALLRNYYATDLPVFITVLMGLNSTALNTNLMELYSTDFLGYLEGETLLLGDANNILLADTNSLTGEMRKSLFYKDIRVFDYCQNCSEQTYIMVDNFQATNAALESSLRLTPLIKENLPSHKKELTLFIQNCLNDLMLKNAQISVIFLQSLDIQREDILSYAMICLIITLVFLGVNTLIMGVTILNHYSTETQNLLAFIRINPLGVREVLAKLKYFRVMLENQNSFEDWLIEDFDSKKTLHIASRVDRNPKKDSNKTPDSKSLVRRYRLHFVGLACLVIITVGLAYWSQKAVQNFIEDLYTKQSQLYFLNFMRSRLNMIGHALNEIVVNGAHSQMENLPILTFLNNSVYEVYNMRKNLPRILAIESLDKNTDFYKILFEDGCELMTFEPFCTHAKKNGVSTSFVESLTVFERIIVDFYEKYSNLNETEQSIYRMPYEDFNLFFAIYCIITGGEPFSLIDIADDAYESTLSSSSTQRNLLFQIFTVTLVLIMVLFWVFILRDLKEVNNRFKKALKTLPPELVLSNFFLKMFLSKTSKGTLDFVRNGI